MRIFSTVLFSLLLISSCIMIVNIEKSYADGIISKSTGYGESTILELKNSRSNTVNIDSVRIWLSGENEFTSFKTEQGWLGKKQLNGVIEFTSQQQVKPGEYVKFGIKTIEENPTINWKAVDSMGEAIASASVKITENKLDSTDVMNQPKIVTIKEKSIFRFIPEKPTADSDFRVVGENFVPNQMLDFYIENKLEKSIIVDVDGKFLFTAHTPDTKDDERTEFILRDSGGNEKSLSMRIPSAENRDIAEVIKLSLGNTPQQVKRGDVITLNGVATPNTTITITSKDPDGSILDINTIQVGFDGKWTYDNLFSPELELGIVSIEINDGKSTALRNIEVITAKIINIATEETAYEPGDTIMFEGIALSNQDMSIVLEDPIGAEIHSRTVVVTETGIVNFSIEIPRGAVEGTYILSLFQGQESGVTVFGVGQEPEEIIILRPQKLNFMSEEIVKIDIQGPSNAQVSLILIDAADREKFSDSINLGPDGREIYEIDSSDLPTGAFTINAKRGESSGTAVFTIGLTTGSGAISVQTTRDDYKPGEQILVLGNTGSTNVLLDISIIDSSGKLIKKIETYSDRFGVFKVDNFRIPIDAKSGLWTVNAKSGGNFKETEFTVTGEKTGIEIMVDKERYQVGEFVNITGSGAKMSSTVTIKIYNQDGEKIEELNVSAKSNGEFLTMWKVPPTIEEGEYEMLFDDGSSNNSLKIIIK